MHEFLVDALGAVLAAWAWVAGWASALFTVWCDPLGVSQREIKALVRAANIKPGLVAARGRASVARIRIVSPEGEHARRAVAWFYRWHATPTLDDWQACVARFGLAGIPVHGLWTAPGVVTGVQIDAAARTRRLWQHSSYLDRNHSSHYPGRCWELSGKIGLGGLEPGRMLEALVVHVGVEMARGNTYATVEQDMVAIPDWMRGV
jgi:hypothetical protein